MTDTAFAASAAEIAQLNALPLDRAEDLLALIGDTPELAEDGRVVARDETGAEVARLRWPVDDGE